MKQRYVQSALVIEQIEPARRHVAVQEWTPLTWTQIGQVPLTQTRDLRIVSDMYFCRISNPDSIPWLVPAIVVLALPPNSPPAAGALLVEAPAVLPNNPPPCAGCALFVEPNRPLVAGCAAVEPNILPPVEG